MKKLMIFLELCQIIAMIYLTIDLVFDFRLFMAVILFICVINVFLVSMMRKAQLTIEKGNLMLYRDFAKRLGWMDIVGELDRMGKK